MKEKGGLNHILCFYNQTFPEASAFIYIINILHLSTLLCLLDIFKKAIFFRLKSLSRVWVLGRNLQQQIKNAMFPCSYLKKGDDEKERLPQSSSLLYSCAYQFLNLLQVIPKGTILEQACILFVHYTYITSVVLALLRRSSEFQVKNIRMNFSFWWIRPKKDTRKLLECQKKK